MWTAAPSGDFQGSGFEWGTSWFAIGLRYVIGWNCLFSQQGSFGVLFTTALPGCNFSHAFSNLLCPILHFIPLNLSVAGGNSFASGGPAINGPADLGRLQEGV